MDSHPSQLLAQRSFSRIADALRRRSGDVLCRWEGSVRQNLPSADSLTFEHLKNTVPEILQQLANALDGARPQEQQELKNLTRMHGEARYQQNFSIAEFITENRLLRWAVVETVWDELGQMEREEVVALNAAMDIHIESSVVRYVSRQAEEIRAASEIQAKYLSFLSHDLRNHLNHALLVLQMLPPRLDQTPGLEDVVEDVNEVQRSIFETVAAMDRLLQAERLRKGAVQPKREPVDVERLLSDVLGSFWAQAQAKGLKLRSEVHGPATVHSDNELLRLVLQNLVGNAVKYSDRGEISVTAEQVPAQGWSVAVCDQGPGIPPEQVARLFEAFSRGNTYGQPGLGLGLAIASHAAMLLGGQLSVEPERACGSLFRLTLPEV